MAFPITSVLDNFNRSEDPLSTGWTGGIWSGESDHLLANGTICQEGPGAFGWGSAYRNSGTFNNSEAYFTLTTKDTNGIVQLYVRITNPGAAGLSQYYLYYDENASTLRIFRTDSGTDTQLGSTLTSFSLSNGDKLGFRASGTTITGYKYTGGTWTNVIEVTDSTYITGYIGMKVNSNASRLDDFGGGEGEAPPTFTVSDVGLQPFDFRGFGARTWDRLRYNTARQWQPTLTAHDPNPPITIDGSSIAPTTVSLNVATLSASGQSSSITVGAVSIALSAATLSALGQVISITSGAVSTTLNVVTLLAQGQATTVVPGAASTSLSVATLTALGQTSSVVSGAVSTTLSAATLTVLGQTVTISIASNVVVNLLAANLTVQGQTITSVGGPVSSSLSAAALGASGQTISIVSGPVSVSLSAAALVATGQIVTVSTISNVSVNLQAAGLAAQGQVITPIGGSVSTTLAVATLTAQGGVITSTGGSVSSSLNAAALTAIGQTISIIPGAMSYTLMAATLTASGQIITIIIPTPLVINLLAASLFAQGQTVSVSPGGSILPPILIEVGGGGGYLPVGERPDYNIQYNEALLKELFIQQEDEELMLIL